MSKESSVSKASLFPKKRLTAALTGLTFTALGFMAEKLFRTVLDTALSVMAGMSIVLLILGLFAFFGAWEKREDSHNREREALKIQMKEIHEAYVIQCTSCTFSHQSLLVGLSTNHVNQMQQQRDYYEEYMAAVLYVLDTTILRLDKSESTVLPIVNGLLLSPLFRKEIENNKELKKWKTFLNTIRETHSKQG